MKKLLTGAILGLTIALLFSFKTVYDLKNSTSDVQQIDGIYVFAYSQPQTAHKIIGKVKPGLYKDSYWLMVDNIIKKTKKTYPTAEGIILKLDMNNYNVEAEVIEFYK